MSSSPAYSNLNTCNLLPIFYFLYSVSYNTVYLGRICGVDLVLQERVLEAEAHERHGPVEAGIDCRGEEGGGDGDPHHGGAGVPPEDWDGHPDPAGDGHRQPDHQAAPARPARHLHCGPVGRAGDGQQAAGPVELHHEDAAENEATEDADEEAVELPLYSDPEEFPVSHRRPEDDCQDGPHQWWHQHAGYQDHARVLHQAWDTRGKGQLY